MQPDLYLREQSLEHFGWEELPFNTDLLARIKNPYEKWDELRRRHLILALQYYKDRLVAVDADKVNYPKGLTRTLDTLLKCTSEQLSALDEWCCYLIGYQGMVQLIRNNQDTPEHHQLFLNDLIPKNRQTSPEKRLIIASSLLILMKRQGRPSTDWRLTIYLRAIEELNLVLDRKDLSGNPLHDINNPYLLSEYIESKANINDLNFQVPSHNLMLVLYINSRYQPSLQSKLKLSMQESEEFNDVATNYDYLKRLVTTNDVHTFRKAEHLLSGVSINTHLYYHFLYADIQRAKTVEDLKVTSKICILLNLYITAVDPISCAEIICLRFTLTKKELHELTTTYIDYVNSATALDFVFNPDILHRNMVLILSSLGLEWSQLTEHFKGSFIGSKTGRFNFNFPSSALLNRTEELLEYCEKWRLFLSTLEKKSINSLSFLSTHHFAIMQIEYVVQDRLFPFLTYLTNKYNGNLPVFMLADEFTKLNQLRSYVSKSNTTFEEIEQALIIQHALFVISQYQKPYTDLHIAFTEFYNVYNKRNAQTAEVSRCDFMTFISTHKIPLHHLYLILGPHFFSFINSLLSTSILPLERYLSQLHNFPEAISAQLTPYMTKHGGESFELTKTFLLLVSSQAATQDIDLSVNELQLLKEQLPLAETLARYKEPVLKNYYKLFLQPDDKVDAQREQFFIANLPDFVMAFNQMRDDYYDQAFKRMLRCDLLGSDTYQRFVSDESQEDEVGASIAKHNQFIRQQLQKMGVDTKLAFDYKKQLTFQIGSGLALNDKKQLLKSIWQMLIQIPKVQIPDTIDEKNKVVLLNQLELIEAKSAEFIRRVVGKSGSKSSQVNTPAEFEKIEANTALLYSITKAARVIQKKHPGPLPEFTEMTKHLADYLEQLAKSQEQSENFTTKRFYVRMWDKSDPGTLLLGKYVGCCLSPEGGRFPAIVQRRNDDAMFMPVVYEEGRSTPIALIWAFFAESNGNPCIVSNFIEIQANYGIKPHLRDPIVNHLIYYLGEYATSLQLSLILRRMMYGLIPDPKFESGSRQIDKLGGFLELVNQDSDKSNNYYLESLMEKIFLKYSPDKLKLKLDNITSTPHGFFDQGPTVSSTSLKPPPPNVVLKS